MEYFKFIIGYILSIITFGKKSFIIFIVYASVNIMLAGTTILFDLYNYRIIILSCIPIIIIYEILSYIKEEKAKNKYYFSIIFKLDKVYKINAYLDTGNDLVEPKTKIPVIIVNEKIKGGKKVKIPYKTINNEDYLEAIYCKDFYIKINHKYMKKEVFVVSKKTKYDGLLNILLF